MQRTVDRSRPERGGWRPLCLRIIKTISILRYLHNEEHRRRIHTQLNKDESIHGLRGEIYYANDGLSLIHI